MLDFEEVNFIGLNCPYFTGVSKHGQKVQLDLTSDCIQYIEDTYCKNHENLWSDCRTTLHIHQDGAMYITTMHYNYRAEEHEEEIKLDLTNNQQFKKELEDYLADNKIYRSPHFPFRASFIRGWESKVVVDGLNSLLKYLKEEV